MPSKGLHLDHKIQRLTSSLLVRRVWICQSHHPRCNRLRTRMTNARHSIGDLVFLHSRTDHEPTGEEALGLLSHAPLDFRQRFQVSGGLGVSLELITQSTPSLLCAVVGSVMTGVVFDQVQFWPAFARIGELFILVPVLLNLKGCLEMNLASRLSTSV